MKRETKDSKLLKGLKEALDENEGSEMEEQIEKNQRIVNDALDQEEGK